MLFLSADQHKAVAVVLSAGLAVPLPPGWPAIKSRPYNLVCAYPTFP